MTFEEWVTFGLDQGWIAKGVCQTHDLVPISHEESEAFESGHDPCIPVLRVWMDKT